MTAAVEPETVDLVVQRFKAGQSPAAIAIALTLGERRVSQILKDAGGESLWRPLCMPDEDYELWRKKQGAGIRAGGKPAAWTLPNGRAMRPCHDCLAGYAADMRAEGRCNGSPRGAALTEADEGEITQPFFARPALEDAVRIGAVASGRPLVVVDPIPEPEEITVVPDPPPAIVPRELLGPRVELLALVPCPDCVHAQVCSLKPMLEQQSRRAGDTLPVFDPAFDVRLTVAVECDHFMAEPGTRRPRRADATPLHLSPRTATDVVLAPDAPRKRQAPDAGPAAAAGPAGPARHGDRRGEDGRTARQNEILEAIRKHRGLSLAARAEGWTPGSLSGAVSSMRRHGTLPDDVAALIGRRINSRPAS